MVFVEYVIRVRPIRHRRAGKWWTTENNGDTQATPSVQCISLDNIYSRRKKNLIYIIKFSLIVFSMRSNIYTQLFKNNFRLDNICSLREINIINQGSLRFVHLFLTYLVN